MQKILVVDDDKDILVVVQLILEIKGYEVQSVSNLNDALTAIKAFNPDALLLDVMLGTESGITLCNEIKSNPDTKTLCVVMFSAHGKEEDILKLCPANAFLPKPFDIHHLVDTIEDAFAKCN